MKIGYIFAGQGAQKSGMGKEFYDHFEASRVVYDRANLALGYDLKSLCFHGSQEELNKTEITQPAILTTSIAILKAFETKIDMIPAAVAGLSLGEYTAHVSAGSLQFEDAVQLVKKRGAFMQNAVPFGIGGMTALTGVTPETVAEIVAEASAFGIVEVCNFNSTQQIVLGGELAALEKAGEIAKEKGAKRIVPLAVSAPFHTSMLSKAETELAEVLETVSFEKMNTPVISNVDGRIVSSEERIKHYLAKQVTSAVQWVDCIKSMKMMGIDTLVEFGPGNALSSFVAKIDRSIKVLSIHNLESFHEAISYFKDQSDLHKAI